MGKEPSKCPNSRPQSSKVRPDQSINLDDSAIRRNPKWGARRPSRYLNLASAYSSVCDNLKTFVNAMMANTNEPRSYEEAVESGKDEWHEAVASEIRALAKNDTWELTPYETGIRVLRGKWVYKIKRDSQGNVVQHKAR
jgi:hypothetical protein